MYFKLWSSESKPFFRISLKDSFIQKKKKGHLTDIWGFVSVFDNPFSHRTLFFDVVVRYWKSYSKEIFFRFKKKLFGIYSLLKKSLCDTWIYINQEREKKEQQHFKNLKTRKSQPISSSSMGIEHQRSIKCSDNFNQKKKKGREYLSESTTFSKKNNYLLTEYTKILLLIHTFTKLIRGE